MGTRRFFTKDFKAAAVQRLHGNSLAEVANALQVHPKMLHRWRREAWRKGGDAVDVNYRNGSGQMQPRSHAVSFRLNQAEFDCFREACSRASARNLSDFARTQMMHVTTPFAQLEAKMNDLTLAVQRLAALIGGAERS